MDVSELEKGLQDIQPTEAEAPYLTMENLMGDYGSWFNNNEGLGELLLGQLRAHNVDTKAATEAMLRQLIQGLVDDLNNLQQQLMGFTQMVNQQVQEAQNVTQSIESALTQDGASIPPVEAPMGDGMLPPEGMEMAPPSMPNEMPPEGPAPEGPAPEGPAPEGPAPEGPAPEGPAPEGPAPEGGEMPPDMGVPSDANVKNIKKPVATGLKLSKNIIDACLGGL